MSETLITIPEPTPAYWAQVLRRWGMKYDEGTMVADLPSELRTELYRRKFSCYPAKIHVGEDGKNIALTIRDSRTTSRVDFTKRGIRTRASELQALVEELSQGQSSFESVMVDKVEVDSYWYDNKGIQMVEFATDIGTRYDPRWILVECELCIELLQAFKEMLRMVD